MCALRLTREFLLPAEIVSVLALTVSSMVTLIVADYLGFITK